MEKKWIRIGKGETIPTSSIIRPINGGLPNITGSRVMMGQDCYYLSVDDAYELLKGLPLGTEAETKERNDATIIKKLIGLVKETDFLSVENRASLLDWLEKQGEHKKFRDSIQVGDKVTKNEDGVLVNLSQLKRVAKKDENQGEQKPAENEELTEFDKAVGVSIGTWNPKTPEQIQSVKAVSKKLLKLAKKQINDEQKPVEKPTKGNYYTCIKDYQFCEHDDVTFEMGKIYKCEEDGKITADNGGLWPFSNITGFFRLSTHEEITSHLQKPTDVRTTGYWHVEED